MTTSLTGQLSASPLHHSYLLIGSPQAVEAELLAFLTEQLGESADSHPDVWRTSSDLFGIDEGRLLRERQQGRPLKSPKQYFVVTIESTNDYAQNALLKTLEEPTPHTHIFLLARSADIFLPTVRSRCVLLSVDGGAASTEVAQWARDFLAAEPSGRLSLVTDLATAITDEQMKKTAWLERLNELERILRQEGGLAGPESVKVFEAIAECRSYLQDLASAPRLLFEYLTFIIPRM